MTGREVTLREEILSCEPGEHMPEPVLHFSALPRKKCPKAYQGASFSVNGNNKSLIFNEPAEVPDDPGIRREQHGERRASVPRAIIQLILLE